MNELNEKLLKFAGFKYEDVDPCNGSDIITVCIYPSGERKLTEPDFPNDLNACFKWLVPEFFKGYGQQKTSSLLEAWAVYISSGAYWGYEAKALCSAIEKLRAPNSLPDHCQVKI